MKTAVIYARYSSERQTEQSIEGQMRVCHEYAKENDILIVDTYIDRAMSGTNDHRAAFQQMMKDSHKKAWDYVLVYKLDRFSRDKYETAIHRRTLKNNGIKLVSAMERIPDSPEGIILESLLEGMNQYYSAELSQKVKRGLRESRSKGNFTGGNLVYGYKVVNKKVVVDEEQAKIINHIFNEVANGVPAFKILEDINNSGILFNGRPLSRSVFYRILSCEKYLGIYRYKEEVFTNIYPRIISDELFAKVNDKYRPNRYCKNKPDTTYLLRFKLVCGLCGKQLQSDAGTARSGKVERYYKCAGKKVDKNCSLKPIKKEFIENTIVDLLLTCISKEFLDLLVDKIYDLHYKKAEDKTMLILLKREMETITTSLKNVMLAIESGIITQSTKERLTELELQKADLLNKIAFEESKTKTQTTKNDIKKYLLKAISKEPLQMINLLVKKVVVFEDRLDIYLNYEEGCMENKSGQPMEILKTTKIYGCKDNPQLNTEYDISIKI